MLVLEVAGGVVLGFIGICALVFFVASFIETGGGMLGGGGGVFTEEAAKYRAEHLEEIQEQDRLVESMFKPFQRGASEADPTHE